MIDHDHSGTGNSPLPTTDAPAHERMDRHGEDHRHGEHDERHLVSITVNHHEYRIRKGRHTVAEVKTVGHVPLADDLEQVRHGNQLHLLPDDGHIEIHGGEVFVSHPKSASSS